MMRIIVAVLMLAVFVPARAEDIPSWTSGSVSIGAFGPPSIVISNLVTIKPDGTIVYGPNYTPDEAARVFWEALGRAKCQ